jgi:hypothetical protein
LSRIHIRIAARGQRGVLLRRAPDTLARFTARTSSWWSQFGRVESADQLCRET